MRFQWMWVTLITLSCTAPILWAHGQNSDDTQFQCVHYGRETPKTPHPFIKPPGPVNFDVIPGKRIGPITAHSSETQLKRIYGAVNVVSGEVYVAEGQCEMGTIIFPDQSDKHLEIHWKDIQNKTQPSTIRIFGATIWALPQGIHINTPATELEKLNGQPFSVNGFGWDYGGYVDWRGGKLAKNNNKDFSLRMDVTTDPARLNKVQRASMNKIYGEVTVLSNTLGFRLANPRVVEMDFSF